MSNVIFCKFDIKLPFGNKKGGVGIFYMGKGSLAMEEERRKEMAISRIRLEEKQGHETRKHLLVELENELGHPVLTFFTSFRYPVMIEDEDVKVLEDVLQRIDTSGGFALIINSPGGDALAAERIIRICRSYSGTGEYWAIVPGKAKSAATMICFGASKIFMGAASELGP
ncbi:SDH family Clp fold serine proteinase, partial [Desulfofundulus sp.]|uniref:SDH family Clp fold serine proteinase n=1 Tax=Desulfofundulus sp. TaxID=2282750 RepID=UPI003C75483D